MFFKIVGFLWIVFGIWWVLRPQALKKRFSKKLKKARRKVLLLIIGLIVAMFFSASRYAHGIWADVFLIAAILGIIKAVFFLTSKAADKILDWWLEQPLWLWRIWAAGFIVIGLLFQKI